MGVSKRIEDFFEGAAGKRLSEVEANPGSSNQHEFNGVRPLAELLGDPPGDGGKRRLRTGYVYLSDTSEPLVTESTATWYDARANHRSRSEYRFYYPAGNEVMELARPGDYVVIAKALADEHRDLVVVVADGRSSIAVQLETMFGLERSDSFDVETLASGVDLTFTSRELLEALGYEVEIADDGFLEQLLGRFGTDFPKTSVFSAFARSTLPDVSALDDPDAALLAWWEREEVLFRTFERHVLGRLITAADGDVDAILTLAMSAFQRRKSRAGHAFENHVAEVLVVWDVPFDSQPRTEGKIRPDFLIPSANAYHDASYDPTKLRVLAVKTTCKDRWRQVISEAARIPTKHLLTLEAPISSDQLEEMRAHKVELVVPAPLHGLFGTTASQLQSVAQMTLSFRV